MGRRLRRKAQHRRSRRHVQEATRQLTRHISRGEARFRMQFDAILRAFADFTVQSSISMLDLMRRTESEYPGFEGKLLEMITSPLGDFVANADYGETLSAVLATSLEERVMAVESARASIRAHDEDLKAFRV